VRSSRARGRGEGETRGQELDEDWNPAQFLFDKSKILVAFSWVGQPLNEDAGAITAPPKAQNHGFCHNVPLED
jgi:hypothetical protein